MAKRSGGPNKSAAIRDYLETNADAKPKEIVEHLKSQGMDVTPAFVSTIKSKLLSSGQISAGSGGGAAKTAAKATKRRGRPKGAAKKATRRGRAPKAAAPAATAAPAGRAASGNVSIDGIVLAKKLADQLGGVDKARAALAALEKITG